MPRVVKQPLEHLVEEVVHIPKDLVSTLRHASCQVITQERLTHRNVEEFVDIPVPQPQEEIVHVPVKEYQDRHHHVEVRKHLSWLRCSLFR